MVFGFGRWLFWQLTPEDVKCFPLRRRAPMLHQNSGAPVMSIPLPPVGLRIGFCTLLLLVVARTAPGQDTLQQQIAAAAEGGVVEVPAGTSHEGVTLERSLTLRGVSPERSILEVTDDRPALSVTDKADVTVESMTIRWQLDTSEPVGPPTAIYAKDATLTLKNCQLIAPAGGKRCPSAVLADGFSKLTLQNCTIEGFEFAVNVSGGAEAHVADCLVQKPGHCGLSVFSDSKLTATRCIIAESAYHAVRSTGGTLIATDNLIVQNRNRGIYLGNKSAQATIRGNVFLANATGISGFAQSEATIERNVFLDSTYAAVDSRDSCRLKIAGNILQGNERGVVLYSETGKHHLQLGSNTFWRNGVDVENLELPSDSLTTDPQLADPQAGIFAASASGAKEAGHGLSDASAATKLWQRWRRAAN
jgi:hypothetical protein